MYDKRYGQENITVVLVIRLLVILICMMQTRICQESSTHRNLELFTSVVVKDVGHVLICGVN